MFYEELVENLEGYKSLITNFFDQEIKCKFPDSNYVFDVYIDIPPNNKVWLIDFNPWILKTDPCLFEWNEVRLFSLINRFYVCQNAQVIVK